MNEHCDGSVRLKRITVATKRFKNLNVRPGFEVRQIKREINHAHSGVLQACCFGDPPMD
jgi:hypothetical protein